MLKLILPKRPLRYPAALTGLKACIWNPQFIIIEQICQRDCLLMGNQYHQ